MPGSSSRENGSFSRLVLQTAAAAAKARDIFLFLTVNGWPLTLAKYKRNSDPRSETDTSEITISSYGARGFDRSYRIELN